jgi:hypothetical protein
MSILRFSPALASLLLVACAHGQQADPEPGPQADAAQPANAERGEASDAGEEVRTYLHLRLPLFSDDAATAPVGRVGDEIITVRNLVDALATSSHGNTGAQAGDFGPVIERLVNARLMLQEARTIGIPEQERAKATLERFRETTERLFLRREIVAGVEADPAEVDRRYGDAAREWELESALFEKEAAARSAHKRIAKGEPFDSVVAEAVAKGIAKGGNGPRRFRGSDMNAAVLAQVEGLQPGQTGPPLRLTQGVALMHVVGQRSNDDPALRKQIEAEVLAEARRAAVDAFVEQLKKSKATIYGRRLKALDLDAPKPGVEAHKKDTRALAEIAGAEPLTVADLVTRLEQKYFHGTQSPARHKQLNADKLTMFDKLLRERLLLQEARRRGIHMTDAYRNTVDDYTVSYLVGLFVQTVVTPEVKVMESEVRARYDADLKAYTTPEMLKLTTIPFTSADAAAAARDALAGGTDLRWFLENGTGIADQDPLGLRGMTVAVASLDADLESALSDAESGDFRLYAGPAGVQYVIHVERRIPPGVQDYRDARKAIAEKLLAEKLERATAAWAEKLREAYPVTLYLTDLDTLTARGL